MKLKLKGLEVETENSTIIVDLNTLLSNLIEKLQRKSARIYTA